MERKSFPFFVAYYEAAQHLSTKDRAAFYNAIIEYNFTAKEPVLKGQAAMCWILVKPYLEKSMEDFLNGSKGGRPRKNRNPGFSEIENPGFGFAETPDSSFSKTNMNMNMKMNIEEDKQQPTAPPAAVAPHKGALGGKAESAPDTESFDIFADFANGDEELLKALRDYDQMRREKRKSLTQTMRRSLCQQLDEEFQPCEWVEIIKQATRQGWLKFYPLDKDKPTNTSVMDDYGKAQLDRILNNLISMNQGDQP